MSVTDKNSAPMVTVPLYRHQEEAVQFVCGLFGLEDARLHAVEKGGGANDSNQK